MSRSFAEMFSLHDPEASRHLLEAIFYQAPVGIAIADFGGHILEANQRCCELLGYPIDELRKSSFVDLTAPEDLQDTNEHLNKLLVGEITEYKLEKRYVRKDGSKVWSHTSVTVLKDAQGHPYRLVGVLQDINQRKLTEEAFLKSEQALQETRDVLVLEQARLQSIIEFSEDVIITKDLHGVVQSWNPAAERVFGYTKEEAIGKPIQSLIIPAELRTEEAMILSKISKGERVEHLETERVTKDGRRLYISLTSSAMKDHTGRIVGATKIARDVTEKKRSQAELAESEARYRALADDRRRLLEMESRARHQVEDANRLKDQFLATLSHELRTPLNAILGWAQLTERRSNDVAKVQEGLQIIIANARNQAQIIEDLLDMNRIMSGTLRLEKQRVTLRSIVDDSIKTVHPAAVTKQLRIEVEYTDPDQQIFADPNRMKQVVWNILTNAVKFTPQNGTISITIQSSPKGLELRISDTGEGIAKDFIPHIFDRFSQADPSSTRKYGGLGLGLSIVKYLVELHDGTITVESEGRGKGAQFTVILPVIETANRSINKTHSVDSNIKLDAFNGLKILVLDDEPDARNLMRTLLEEYGAHVMTAQNVQEALAMLDAQSVNLIISDIGMPSQDGYEFIKQVRKHPRKENRTIPAIALTAYARSEDRIRALQAGFQSHIPKPIESSELFAVISSVTK